MVLAAHRPLETEPLPGSLFERRPRRLVLSEASTPRWLVRFGLWTTVLFVLVCVALLFTPWQQSIRGSGKVVAYLPSDRMQSIDAPIGGQIVSWEVAEGSQVRKGDPICTLQDNDPNYVANLDRILEAAETKYEAAQAKVAAYATQVEFLTASKVAALQKADGDIAEAEEKVRASAAKLTAAGADFRTAEINRERSSELFELGLISRRDWELAELKHQETQSYLEEARANKNAADQVLISKKADREKIAQDADAKISSAVADERTARGDLSTAEASLAKARSDRSRQRPQVVAPRDGTILRLLANPDGQQVKAGDPLAIIVPETSSRAVELYVSGNDAPLIFPGEKVRLQFEGWPAVQFTGWPSVARGTFGGSVQLVDSTDNGMGQFRVLILPDPELERDPETRWPKGVQLRQGVRANGWVLLRQVTLGFELWRQLNGFPPTVDRRSAEKESKPEKMTRSLK